MWAFYYIVIPAAIVFMKIMEIRMDRKTKMMVEIQKHRNLELMQAKRDTDRSAGFEKAQEGIEIASRDQKLVAAKKLISDLEAKNRKLLEDAEMRKPMEIVSNEVVDPRLIDATEFVDNDVVVGLQMDDESVHSL